MKLEVANKNYAAQIVRIPALVELKGLDNLVGVPTIGHQALTQRADAAVGDLRVAFTAETQLSHEYASANNLYRESELNADPNETGYLEKNRRIRALKLRGHRSDALLMPLESLAQFVSTTEPLAEWEKELMVSFLKEGDTFDTIGGVEICRKYVVPVKGNPRQASAEGKLAKAFKRVDKKLFPEHLDTDAYWRSKHLLNAGREVVVTQKLHGTSIRIGRVPCLRQKGWLERQLNRWFPTADHTYDAVFGSRKVIKDVNNPNQIHHYDSDIWTEYGKTIADLIPEGYLVYAELVGWTPNGEPIQKGYTYEALKPSAHLYVYRVATINAQGTLADLPWDGVRQFCLERGLKWTPELARLPVDVVDEWLEAATDAVFHDDWSIGDDSTFVERPVRLSGLKTVDEGVCLRQEGVVPILLKAKAPKFFEHETKLLDKGEVDLESAA